jgi:hypothetical protein
MSADTTNPSDDWLAAERERYGPVTEDEIHAGYDAVLDARVVWREADTQSPPEPASTEGIPDPPVSHLLIERGPTQN